MNSYSGLSPKRMDFLIGLTLGRVLLAYATSYSIIPRNNAPAFGLITASFSALTP